MAGSEHQSETAAARPDRDTLESIFASLREREGITIEQVQRLYRRLVRETHPDRTGDDGTLFRLVQTEFAALRAQAATAEHARRISAGLDPYAVLVDMGLTRDTNPRAALYASLYRFRAIGLASWRVRTRPQLRHRNARVIRTVLHWGARVDSRFPPLFEAFLRDQAQFTIMERRASLYFLARRTLLRGLDLTIRYHDSARPATAEIAREVLRYCLLVTDGYARDAAFASLRGLAHWLLAELDRESVRIGLDL